MFLNILFVIAGVALVLWGADRLTDGAASLARRMSVPEIVIGLTIVAAGTSAPELFVSLVSAIKGTPGMAVGNVIGSNIFNTMLIVGCSAIVAPMTIAKSTVKKDMPFVAAASLLLIVLCTEGFTSVSIEGNAISRTDGIILLAGFTLFMAYTMRMARKGKITAEETPADTGMSVWKCIMYVAMGLAGLIVGSNVFVDSASAMARSLGISDGVIGLTIVAGGTSMPELATSVVAARKGRSAIAIGNVIGSNVFNILAILGVTAVVCPMTISGISTTDLLVMTGSILAVWLFSFTKYTVERWEGALLTAGFMAYLCHLLISMQA